MIPGIPSRAHYVKNGIKAYIGNWLELRLPLVTSRERKRPHLLWLRHMIGQYTIFRKCIIHILSCPMILFSSLIFSVATPSGLFLSNKSRAIDCIVVLRRFTVIFIDVGSFWSIGKTGPIRNTKRERRLPSTVEKDSNTSTTGLSLPSRAWKLWPNPPIPMESRLCKWVSRAAV